MNKKMFLIFIGPPGSGKGTQTDMLAEKLEIPAVSPGELLRQEVKNKTIIGRKIEKILASGKFVENDIVEELLKKRLAKKDAKSGVIFDGFPRNFAQMSFLEKKLENSGKNKNKILVVYIHISDKEAKKRLSRRRVCFCGATYHLDYNPPKKKDICDVCGKRLMHRADDKPDVVTRRLKLFHKENDPIMKHFVKEKILVKINGEQTIDKIQKDILKYVI
ncbi:MAG: nucleoside monophosphate kinase [Patescibacteria group bacterium]|jgi:adenylate kinase